MLARIRKALKEREEGFTLIELLVVIIIIGILAAIAIPVFLNQRNKAYDAAAKSDAKNAATAEESYLTSNNAYMSALSTADFATLATQGFKGTSGVSMAITAVGGTAAAPTATAPLSAGYCIVVKSQSGNYFLYDSLAGGLSATTYSSTPAATTSGACSVSGATTAPVVAD